MLRNGLYHIQKLFTQYNRPIITNLQYKLTNIKYFHENLKRFQSLQLKNSPFTTNGKVMLGFSILTLLGMDKKTVVDEIVMNLKRSILMMRQEKYQQAEQLLHLTLRLAQQTQNELAITYIYDVMANLAFVQNYFDKAEKLFVVVMQRLLAEGYAESDKKNIHISLKLARICHLKGENEKAKIGFDWCFNHFDVLIKNPDLTDDDKLLYALGKDWYGHYLFHMGYNDKAYILLEESYEIMKNYEEDNMENIVVLLSDMATIKETQNDLVNSEKLLRKAIKIGLEIPKYKDLPVLYVNLGRLLIQMDLLEEARKNCGRGFKLASELKANKYKNEALKCLAEVKRAK